MLKYVPAAAGQQHIVHVPPPIVDPLDFRGLCLKECIPAGRRTMRVLRIVSFGDHFPLASAKRSVPSPLFGYATACRHAAKFGATRR